MVGLNTYLTVLYARIGAGIGDELTRGWADLELARLGAGLSSSCADLGAGLASSWLVSSWAE
jgi:hypothetical protein